MESVAGSMKGNKQLDKGVRKRFAHPGMMFRSAVAKLPIPTDMEMDIDWGEHNYDMVGAGELPEQWDVPRQVARDKITNKLQLRRGYTLFKMRKNKMVDEIGVGRNWNTDYPMKVTCTEGFEWGNVKLALEPIFAGLADETLEKQSANALANLPFAFAGTSARDFTAYGRYAVRDLANRQFNPVRFMYRLCVLYFTAQIMEAKGQKFVIRGLNG